MENKSGVCRFCGQYKIIEVPGYSTQEEIDEEVTLECRCEAAKEYQEKKQKEELMEMVKISAQGTIYELVHEDKPEIEQLLNNCIPLLVTKKSKDSHCKHRQQSHRHHQHPKRHHQGGED